MLLPMDMPTREEGERVMRRHAKVTAILCTVAAGISLASAAVMGTAAAMSFAASRRRH